MDSKDLAELALITFREDSMHTVIDLPLYDKDGSLVTSVQFKYNEVHDWVGSIPDWLMIEIVKHFADAMMKAREEK
jgi:hypothetical protein